MPPDSTMGQSVSRKPPVSCGHCGTEIRFEPGQLVGDPAAVDRVKRYQVALRRIAEGDFPMATVTEDMQRVASEALSDVVIEAPDVRTRLWKPAAREARRQAGE